MKASEMIAVLQSMIETYGDLPIRTAGLPDRDGEPDRDVEDVRAYTEIGTDADKGSPAVEFYLHG